MDSRAATYDLPECSHRTCHRVALQRCKPCRYSGCQYHMHFDKRRLPKCPICGGDMEPAT